MRSRPKSLLVATVLLGVLAPLLGVAVAAPATASITQPGKLRSWGKAVEVYAPYQPQTTCATKPSKGALLLSRWLLTRYKGSTSSGIMRACSRGAGSEHKDGRAFDWHVDHRTARGRAQGLAFLQLVRGTDRYGNTHAIARRLGIMYIIWNDRIYSASSGFRAQPYKNHACPSGPVTRCSSTLRHIDHMHISLGWSGARAITSFWDGTVAPVTPPPPPPALNQTAHPVVALSVPSDGTGVQTSYSLKAGTTYRLVATGWYRHGTGGTDVADAQCSWHQDDDAGWDPQAEGTSSATRLKLTVNGAAGWRPLRSSGACDRTHTYVWDLKPSSTRQVTFAVDDPQRYDDRGTLVVHILRAGASATRYTTAVPAVGATPPVPTASKPAIPALGAPETVEVSPAGTVRSAGWLVAGRTYDLDVSGTWSAGDGVVADAECSRTPNGTWRSKRSADPLHPTLDHYDLYLDGVDLPDQACAADHVYHYVVTATRDSRIGLNLWDRDRSDDSGSVSVQISPRSS